ncbi:CsgG/HfaB family protein [Sutterella wadsworthensis]|uniref:CsgG/HfaB family protein n=1 Tax=Sutterella wadsworthensis TaxID=40545 RepID=UPI0013F59FE4|nr:CsgG/HfaB family protein [Sutterella wadsworthensis]
MSFKLQMTAAVSAFMLFCGSAVAGIVTVETTGVGADYVAARLDALKEALMQVSGVSIDVNSLRQITTQSDSETANGQTNKRLNLSKSQQQNIEEQVRGYIDSYQELNRQVNADGMHEITLSVNIYKYDAVGIQDERRTIAVLGIQSTKGGCSTPAAVAELLTEALQNELIATRKFAVLKRSDIGVEREKAYLSGDDVHRRERARLGQGRGADYVVSGRVIQFAVNESKQTIKLTGDQLIRRSAKFSGQFDLIFTATNQVKFSKKINITLDDSQLRGLDCTAILGRLSQETARRLVEAATLDIYPPLIVKLNGGKKFTVNYGNEVLKNGDAYEVFNQGEKIYDPYIRESLGRDEIRVGNAVVIDAKPKYSVLELIEGDVSQLQEKGICRPVVKAKPVSQPVKPKPKAALRQKIEDAW